MAEPERVPPSRADGGETRVAERQGRHSCGRQRGREVRGAETMLHAALQPRSVHAGGAGIPCHGERLSNFTDIKKGDIVVGDRAYGNMPGIAHVRKLGADFALRMRGWKHAFFDEKNRRMDMSGLLSALKEGETADIPAKCRVNGQYEPVRVCAFRKDAGSEGAGLERLMKENQRKQGGKQVSQAQRESNKYIVVATSLGGEVSAEQVMGACKIFCVNIPLVFPSSFYRQICGSVIPCWARN